jgi:CRP-like cAMP-binding protein
MLEPSDFQSLCRSFLFRGIPGDELAELIRPCRGSVQSWNRGAIIAFRGDRYERLMIVLEGQVSGEFRDYDGRVLKVETLKSSEVLASAVLFSSQPFLPVNMHAATDVRIFSLPANEVLQLCRRDERVLRNLLEDGGNKLNILAEKLRLVHFSSIRAKIAGYVLDQADTCGTDSFELSISKEKLAELFGVARPSLSREFSRLREEGILYQEGRRIQLLDRRALHAILQGKD